MYGTVLYAEKEFLKIIFYFKELNLFGGLKVSHGTWKSFMKASEEIHILHFLS